MRPDDNLPGCPWIWRRAGDNAQPLNANVRKTKASAKLGPKTAGGLASNAGTMHGLTPRADALLALRHSGVYSKAVA